MLVLEVSRNKKGTALEEITRKILEHLGYCNCISNEISSGGFELDVTGEYPIAHPGGTSIIRFLCECKAHSNPVGMTDWLKFLGKIFAEEARQKSKVMGCFIALCGVNGNVAGHYNQLKQVRDDISLVHGDALVALVARVFSASDQTEVALTIKRYTPRTSRLIEVAHFNGEIFWVVAFSGDEYTLLRNNCSPLSSVGAETLRHLVEQELDVGTFIDLEEEVEGQRRQLQARALCISQVMLRGNEPTVLKSEPGYPVTVGELNHAAELLCQEEILDRHADGQWSIRIIVRDDCECVNVAVFRNLLSNPDARALGCASYDRVASVKLRTIDFG